MSAKARRVKISLFRILVLFTGCLALYLAQPYFYWHWHCSEAPSFSVIRGVEKLKDPQVRYAEIEPGLYLCRSGDIAPREDWHHQRARLPFDVYLESLGWTFFDQMGAGVTYERNSEHIRGMLTSCSSSYLLLTLYEDPVNGAALNRSRPFNLFSSI